MEAKHTTGKKAHIGAQNDALFVILGEAPAATNDYPRHDADRTAIAKVYEEDACRRMVACWNACEGISSDALLSGTALITAFQREQDRADTALRQREELLSVMQQIERLAREANVSLVDVPAMLGDIARAALAKATQ